MTDDIELILDKRPENCNINIQADGGFFSSLVDVAESGAELNVDDHELFRFAVQGGANVNSGKYGSILSTAIVDNSIDIVAFLIIAGADINKLGISGYTPLVLAIYHNRIEIVEMLQDMEQILI